MKSTSKNGSPKSNRKRQSRPAKKKPTNNKLAQLLSQVETIQRELTDAHLRESATAEILRVIAGSPTDIRPVLDAIVETAARVCGIDDVLLRLVENESMIPRAHFGPMPVRRVEVSVEDEPQFRWMRDHGTLHIPDTRAQSDFPMLGSGSGFRTFLGAPVRRQGRFMGALFARRTEVRPFSPVQIKLLETFADQAAIALEDVRVIQELKESLDQQTATSEILGVIASSPTDIYPVLDTIAASAARLCDSHDAIIQRVEGDSLVRVAHFGPVPVGEVRPLSISRELPSARAIVDRQTVHVEDVLSEIESEFPNVAAIQKRSGSRTVLATPLLSKGLPIGVIMIRRTEVRPFSEKQIALLKTFTDQAVIAIENVRLFQELQARNRDLTEALDQQTATSEILRVLASSPTNLQTVLDTVIANAVRLARAQQGHIRQYDGELLRIVAHCYEGAESIENLRAWPVHLSTESLSGRVFLEKVPVQILDAATELGPGSLAAQGRPTRTMLTVPLLRRGETIGTISIWRDVVQAFTDEQIKLITTFADQAVIAIENVRLFQELHERNTELREALEHQTATAEVLGIISRSPTDVQPVLNAIVESAARVCGIDDVLLRLRERNTMHARAHYGHLRVARPEISVDEPEYRWLSEHGTLHIPQFSEQNDLRISNMSGWRTFLAVPLYQHEELIGGLVARRADVRPFTSTQIKLLETFADQAVIALENVRLFQELKVSLEQQTATSDVLRVIAGSPTELQPVLDAVTESAVKLAGAKRGHIGQYDGEFLRLVASYGESPEQLAVFQVPVRPRHESRSGRAFLERKPIHDLDAQVERHPMAAQTGARTSLAIPLLREDTPIGVFTIWRDVVEPFNDRQIELVKTFADQAVVAIENVRLFKEIQERNAELREALEHQTATAEVLGIISRSPRDVQPVLDAIVESAARVCGIDDVVLRLREENNLVSRAHFGPVPLSANRIEIDIDEPQYRWMRERGTLHIPDISEWNDFQVVSAVGWRSRLTAPLRQQGEIVGVLTARRIEVHPFTPAQIKLLETFADQAVIAIENVRLFRELTEALEQQTATSEILGVIASSPTDIQPVFDTILAAATRLCGAPDGAILLTEQDFYRCVATCGSAPTSWSVGKTVPIDRGSVTGRAIVDRQTIHIHDIQEVVDDFWQAQNARRAGLRTMLATPLLREGIPIGVIGMRRAEVQPFTDKQISILKTFADQAVIAIENVRLFRELGERNAELREALEHQTATSEVLGIISRSPTDVQPVLDAIVESAARVCGIDNLGLRLREGNTLVSRARIGPIPIPAGREEISIDDPRFRWIRQHGTLHIPDARAQNDFPTLGTVTGARTFLIVPLRQQDELIGTLSARRTEVRPFTPAQIKLLETFADQAVIAIENVRLFQELQTRTSELARSVGELKALGEVGQAVSSTLDLQTVLSTIVSRAVQLSGTDCGIIYEYDEPTEEFHLRASYQMEEELVKAYQATPLRLGQGATGRAAEVRAPTQITDLR